MAYTDGPLDTLGFTVNTRHKHTGITLLIDAPALGLGPSGSVLVSDMLVP